MAMLSIGRRRERCEKTYPLVKLTPRPTLGTMMAVRVMILCGLVVLLGLAIGSQLLAWGRLKSLRGSYAADRLHLWYKTTCEPLQNGATPAPECKRSVVHYPSCHGAALNERCETTLLWIARLFMVSATLLIPLVSLPILLRKYEKLAVGLLVIVDCMLVTSLATWTVWEGKVTSVPCTVDVGCIMAIIASAVSLLILGSTLLFYHHIVSHPPHAD